MSEMKRLLLEGLVKDVAEGLGVAYHHHDLFDAPRYLDVPELAKAICVVYSEQTGPWQLAINYDGTITTPKIATLERHILQPILRHLHSPVPPGVQQTICLGVTSYTLPVPSIGSLSITVSQYHEDWDGEKEDGVEGRIQIGHAYRMSVEQAKQLADALRVMAEFSQNIPKVKMSDWPGHKNEIL
jgi:hypothetical protein